MESMGQVAVDYFHNLFTSRSLGDSTKILFDIKVSITPKMNTSLMSNFTKDIYKDLKGMRPTKAPGIDGFSALVFL